MASGTVVDPALLSRLQALRPGTTGEVLEGARWGVLLTPPPAIERGGAPAGAAAAEDANGELRVVLFCSFWIGQATLQAVLAHMRRVPGRLRLVGVVTDDPISPQARISLKKRAWGLMSPEERLAVTLRLVGTALEAGVPVYTGEIKTPGFRRALAARWRPHAILTCGFGQVLDLPILDAVPCGAYNCHPTDLLNGHGAGPSPWADMTARGVHHTKWSVHRMTEVVDAGPVIGQTPPINVGDAEGRLPEDNRAFFYKVLPPIGWMVLRTLDALARRRERGLRGTLPWVDMNETMPPGLRRRLDQPIAPDWQAALQVPTPDEEVFAALRDAEAEVAVPDRIAAVGS